MHLLQIFIIVCLHSVMVWCWPKSPKCVKRLRWHKRFSSRRLWHWEMIITQQKPSRDKESTRISVFLKSNKNDGCVSFIIGKGFINWFVVTIFRLEIPSARGIITIIHSSTLEISRINLFICWNSVSYLTIAHVWALLKLLYIIVK